MDIKGRSEEKSTRGGLWEGVILKGKSGVYRKKYPPKLLTVEWRGERRKLKPKENERPMAESFFSNSAHVICQEMRSGYRTGIQCWTAGAAELERWGYPF